MPPPFAVGSPDTITLGSASKTFWGGLRIGWVRAPQALVPTLVDSRATLDLGAAPLEQLVLAELLVGPGDPGRATRPAADRRDQLLVAARGAAAGLEVRAARPAARPSGSSCRAGVQPSWWPQRRPQGLIITPGHRFFSRVAASAICACRSPPRPRCSTEAVPGCAAPGRGSTRVRSPPDGRAIDRQRLT